MRRMLTAVALLIAASAAAHAASCKDEVATALERQRKMSGFRMETMMLSPEGKVNMTVDYLLPDRMRQVITSAKEPEPVETVVVGNLAWTRQGKGAWSLVHPQIASALVNQMEETVGNPSAEVGDFECLGKKPVGDKDLLAYQGENEGVGPKNVGPDAKDKPKLPDRPVRIIYVDSTTGLPMRSVFVRANKIDKPIFEATYSYPVDLKIEAPKPKAASQ
jgi:hypothetical protein